MQFAGKVALITGAGKGLGKAFAEALLQRGSKVCITDINEALVTATHQEFAQTYGKENIVCKKCDVTQAPSLEKAFVDTKNDLKGLDIVVNNAGIVNETDWELTIDVNLKAVMRGTLLGIEHLRNDNGGNGGTIVNVASMAGLLPVPHTPAYAASKHGVVGYTKSWANHKDIINNNIKLVALCPAYTRTDILKVDSDTVMGTDLAEESLKQLGIMKVETVVEAFLKLLNDEDNSGKALAVMKKHGMVYK